MTDRIVTEAGEYAPQPPVLEAPEGVDPKTLPQIKKDPWASVDHRDFSSAHTLDRGRLLFMAQLASSRGDAEAAMEWKRYGITHQEAEANAAQVETMNAMLKPKKAIPPGRIVTPKGSEPWASDPAYLAATKALRSAQGKARSLRDGTSQRMTANAEVLRVRGELESVVGSLQAACGWTEADQRVADAQASLREKSKAVAAMFGGPT